ncbi:MAG: SBBP repeat-containing protein [Acidobacteria bacterium]|nr:SBBP repeat-containing protein [Acidobacteriota bacterium]
MTRGSGYSLFLTANEAVLRLRKTEIGREAAPGEQADGSSVLRMRLLGANPELRVTGVDQIQTKSNYFIGNDPLAWRTNIANFAKVKYGSVYPGIDLVWYGNQNQLEHDFIVAPGADPRSIKLEFAGTSKLSLNQAGDLILEADGGEMRLLKPVAWQESGGEREQIACNYQLAQTGQIEFELGPYDHAKTLVIDPILIYSTFIGGNQTEVGRGIAVDRDGNAYVVGETNSLDFPVVNPIQAQPGSSSIGDIFVLKINPSGTALVYSTYLGGNSFETGYSIAVGDDGSAYFTGYTISNNFPTTANALQRTLRGGFDAFVTRINPTGSALVYSTYLGDAGLDRALGIAVNASGEAYVAGHSDSANLPANGFQKTRSGNVVYKSTNNGGDWNAGDSGLLASLIYTMAVDPSNPNNVYAGTSDGVYKTTDGGSSWQKSGNFITTQGIAIDPKNPMTVFAATNFGLHKSTDGGSTWQEKRNGLLNAFQFFTVLFDSATTATVYVGTDRGVFKSTDGGDNFAIASNGLGQVSFPGQPPQIRVTALVADPINSMNIYAATDRGMFKTLNGGGMWFAINNGISTFAGFLALAIDPAVPTTLYLSTSFTTRGSLYKSIDGGNSWVLSSEGLSIKNGDFDLSVAVYSIAVNPSAPSIVYAGTQIGGLFKSTDGGANWSQSNRGLNNVYIRSLAIAPSSPATIYAGVFGGPDGFVAKLNASGSSLSYLTYLGGFEADYALGIAVDPDGNAFVAGQTDSANFPTAGAIQAARSGFGTDAYVAKINPTGTALVYSTYLGGNSTDFAEKIALDASGSAYVAGSTLSTNFPTRSPLQSANAGGFYDAFVAKLNPAGSALEYSTYLGGSDRDNATGIAVDRSGNVYIAGFTLSANFPVKDQVQNQYQGSTDAFVAKINSGGSTLVYSTWLGGTRGDAASAIAVDTDGNAYVTGVTDSVDWPTVNPLQSFRGSSDMFVAKLGVQADMAITKTASRSTVMVNNNLAYTITVTNLGPSSATGVVVTDQLQSSVTFVSATATQGSCSNNLGTVTCSLGEMAVQANASITLVVTPATTGAITNTARVRGNEPDSIQANNQASAQTTVSNLPSIAGRVTGANGQGLAGVSVTIRGDQLGGQQTDNNGIYQFAGLTIGGAYTVSPSSDSYSFEPASRSFADLRSDQTADFTASVCSYSIGSSSQSFSATGGDGVISVTATPRCQWTAASSADWIRITSGTSGAGNGLVNFTVAAATAPRSERITVAGINFAVYQGVEACAMPSLRDAGYYLGNTFASSGEGGPARVIATDFDGDGRSDLVTLNILNRAVLDPYRLLTILAGNGQGAFTTLSAIRLPGTVQTIAVGDFNGDRRPDVVDLNGSNVEVRLNNWAGGLNAPSQYPSTPINRFGGPGIITGDFNRDDKIDLLLFANDSFERMANVRIMLNNGSGGLNPAINVSLRDHIVLGLADVNADSNLDLLTYATIPSGSTVVRELRLYQGDGAGSFGSPVISNVNGVPSTTAFGDFNGDGKTDAAFYLGSDSSSQPGRVTLVFGDGSGRFGSQINYDLPAEAQSGLSNLLAIDLNNDGITDLLPQSFGRLFFLRGGGPGSLLAGVKLVEISGLTELIAADLNGDGKIDLAAISSSTSVDVARVLSNRCGTSPAIFGRVTEGSSPFGVSGATIRLTGASNFAAQTQTDSGGNYLFASGLTQGADYTVTAERPLFRFTPESKATGNLTSDQVVNFTAARTATVVSAASFRGEAIAPESIAAIFGDGMTVETRAVTTLPLPTQLGGASVTIEDSTGAERPVRFFFISPRQINVLVPPGLATGPATVTVTQLNSTSFPQTTIASLMIDNVAPGLFSLDATGRGLAAAVILRVKADGTQVYEPVAQFDPTQQQFVATPIDLSNQSEQVFLIPFGTGIRNRSTLAAVTAKIGGLDAEVTFGGAQGDFFGVDQVNLRMPRALAGRGDVEIVITADGKITNAVRAFVK